MGARRRAQTQALPSKKKMILPLSFYQKEDVVAIARELLGKFLFAEPPVGVGARQNIFLKKLLILFQRSDNRYCCRFQAGQLRTVAGELESLVRGNPSRERFRYQLMLALYRAGRQADALETFQRLGLPTTRDEASTLRPPKLRSRPAEWRRTTSLSRRERARKAMPASSVFVRP